MQPLLLEAAGMPRYAGDTLLYRDRVFRLRTRPLEQWFQLIGHRPLLSRPAGQPPEAPDYAATWKVGSDDLLRLVGLTGSWPDTNPLALGHLFPLAESSVVATWFSGLLTGVRAGPVGRALAVVQEAAYQTEFPRDALGGPLLAGLALEIQRGQVKGASEATRAAEQLAKESPRWASALV